MTTSDILQGWNAIADFLACDVRTAKRWEQDRGLPVRRTRRTPGEGRPNVYALVSDLEEWRNSAGSLDLSAPPASVQPSDTFAHPTTDVAEFPASETPLAQPPEAEPKSLRLAHSRHIPVLGLIAAGIVIALAAALAVSARGHHPHAANLPAEVSSALPATLNHPAPGIAGSHAQELYLQGSYLLEQRTPETLAQARLDFAQTIAADPNYAPAYTGLAMAYDLLREYGTMPSAQAYPLARQAALHAIALDPSLADAHAALGYEEFFWEWNGAAAEREFRQAIALNPNSVAARHWFGAMLMHQARFQEALEQLGRAQLLAPASAAVLGTRAYALGLSGRRNEAADLLQDILTRVPDSAPLHFILAQLSLQQPRDTPRYLDQMRRYAQLRHSDEQIRLFDAGRSAYQQHGEAAMWNAMLEFERRAHPAPDHPTYFMVQCEAELNMRDAVVRDLNQLARDHNEFLIGLDIDTTLASLRNDPGFKRIVAQVGLPQIAAEPDDAPPPAAAI